MLKTLLINEVSKIMKTTKFTLLENRKILSACYIENMPPISRFISKIFIIFTTEISIPSENWHICFQNKVHQSAIFRELAY